MDITFFNNVTSIYLSLFIISIILMFAIVMFVILFLIILKSLFFVLFFIYTILSYKFAVGLLTFDYISSRIH